MELNHEGKIALITGANKGIGFEAARHLGAQGVTAYLRARNLHLEEFAEEKLKADGADAYFIVNRLTLRRVLLTGLEDVVGFDRGCASRRESEGSVTVSLEMALSVEHDATQSVKKPRSSKRP